MKKRKFSLKQAPVAHAVQLASNSLGCQPVIIPKPKFVRDVVYLHPEQVANLYYDRDAIKPRYFEMVFDVDTVNQVIDDYRVEHNLADAEETPPHVVYSVYHGDLIILLKEVLIPLEQEWFFGIDSHFYNYETDEVQTVPLQIQTPKMSWKEFRFGSTKHVERGHGLRTRWRGIGEEIEEFLEKETPAGFKRIRSDVKVSIETGFSDYNCQREFEFIKNIIDKHGLEVLKKVNDEIDQFIEKEKAEGRIYEQAIA